MAIVWDHGPRSSSLLRGAEAHRQAAFAAGVALKLLELSQDENVSNAEISQVLKTDPALCGRLIKIANSASFAGTRPIASVPDALLIIGFNAIRQLALGLSLVSTYSHGTCANFDYRDFWAHSLNAAIGTQLIVRNLGIASLEELFVCGLLCRIGYLALATVYPQQYSNVLADQREAPPTALAELEQKRFGIDHNELTRELMLDWRLPMQLAEPVAMHEYPDAADFPDGSRACKLRDSVHLAHLIATFSLGSDGIRAKVRPDLLTHGDRLGIEADVMLHMSEEVTRVSRTWSSLLAERRAPTPQAAAPAATPAISPIVLLVCENVEAASGYEALFRAQGYAVSTARNNQAALRGTFELEPDIIVVAMPQTHAMNFCCALRATDLGQYPYLIVIAATEDSQHELAAFEAGAEAWLAHPVEPKRIVAQLHAARRALGLQDDLRAGQQELRRPAAGLAAQNRQLQQVPTVDALTGLPNRHYVRELLPREWDASQRSATPLSCVWIEVDGVRDIKDAYGNAIVEGLIKQVGSVLERGMLAGHVVCHLGNAEFLIVCPAADVGLDGHGPWIFDAIRDFVRKTLPFDVQVTLPTAFPGAPFYERLKRAGRLLEDGAWDRCTLFDLNYRPRDMSVEELRSGFRNLVVDLYGEAFTRARREHFNRARSRRVRPAFSEAARRAVSAA